MISNTINKFLLYFLFYIFLVLILPFDVFATQPVEKTLYEEICDIRKMFCGSAALGIVTGAIAILGFMLFKGKLNMGVLFVTIVGIVVFVSANILAEALFNPPGGVGVVVACSCL